MATNRQERELMRQRGAGTRQIKDLEFQLVLPGQPIVPREPLSPQRSGRSRRTPQTRKVLGPRFSTRKPATARKKGAGKPSSSEVPISEGQDSAQGILPSQSNREGKATKKRKTGAKMTEAAIDSNGRGLVMDRPITILEEQGDLPQTKETTSHPPLQAHGRKRKKRKSIGQNSRKKPRLQNVDRDPESSVQPPEVAPRPLTLQQEASADAQNREVKEQSQSSAEILAIEPESLPPDSAQDLGGEDVQNLTLTSSKPSAESRTKRKKRKSIGQQRPRRKVVGSATAGDSVPSARSDAPEATPQDQDGSSTAKKSRGRGQPKKILSTLVVGDVHDEALHDTNITDVTRNTRSAGGRGRPKKILSSADVDVQEEVLKDMNNSNATRNARTARGRGRPRKGIPVDAATQEDDEDDGNGGPKPVEKLPTKKRGRPKLNVPNEASEALTTVKQRRVRKKDAGDPDATDGKIPSASRKPPKNSMPITVYRMSTNDAPDSEHDHPDTLTNSSTLLKNDNVNAVDVLAQVCRELVSKNTDSLGEAAKNEHNKTKKATLERKRKNIETYGEELDNRLFQLKQILLGSPDRNSRHQPCALRTRAGGRQGGKDPSGGAEITAGRTRVDRAANDPDRGGQREIASAR